MKEKKLSVRLHGGPVGILEQLPTGKMTFSYLASSKQAVSLAMPIREEPYNHLTCEAFFGGLLPESEQTKKIIGKIYHISPSNTFALLKAIGYDCAGAISFHDINETVKPQPAVLLEGQEISDEELYIHIKALPKQPLFLGFEDLRLSLAGVHDKAAICIIDNKIALPKQGCPTTHILKPAVPEFPGIVENEYVCMELASRVGLSVAKVEVRQIKEIRYLLVKRYDRSIHDNQVRRIHQEDFCQALNIVSSRKYQNEGGPSFEDCFAIFNTTTHPAVDRNRLAAAMAFNFLIGNMDAHGKNFSILHPDQTHQGLAPLYDLLCTRFYPNLTTKMAMKIGGEYQADKILPRHWQKQCEKIQFSYPALKKLIIKQAEIILKSFEDNSKFFIEMTQNELVTQEIINMIRNNVTKILKLF